MADRVDDLLRAEREVVADLSHRLRSPLTALRLQAEGLDAADSSAMTIQIDRPSREVDRIIAEARTPGVNTDRRADLVVVARERAAFWSALAEEQGRLMSISLPPGPVFGAITAEDLAVAIDVLIDNVFSHTPSGTALHVEVMAGPPRLIVQDAGPGFDDAAIERGASGARSTGLGLDIARRTAAGAGGSIAVERAPGGGSRVVLTTASP